MYQTFAGYRFNKYFSIMVWFLLFFFFMNYCNGNPVSFINKCHIPDDECVTNSARVAYPYIIAGIPEYKMSSLDPLKIDVLNVTRPNLKLVFTDVVVTGGKDCQLYNFSATENKVSGEVVCDIVAKANYDIEGKLLSIFIQDNGTSQVKMNKVQIEAEGHVVVVDGKDGRKHWKLTTLKHNYKLNSQSSIKLLKSDKKKKGTISQIIEHLMNENPNEFILEMAPPIVDEVVSILSGNLKRFLQNTPLSELITNAEIINN